MLGHAHASQSFSNANCTHALAFCFLVKNHTMSTPSLPSFCPHLFDNTRPMESSTSSASASASLPDPDEGFALSLDDPKHPTNFTKPSVDKTGTATQEPQYILGTLIVRVVAARNLELPSLGGGGFFGGGGVTANPYASVKFGNSTQRSC
jgi:hypothetical protein